MAKDGNAVVGRGLAVEDAANDRAAGVDGLDKEHGKCAGVTLAAAQGDG